jgi:hypothetical protein
MRVLKPSEVATNDTRAEAGRMLLDAPMPAVLDLPYDGNSRITLEIFLETEGAVEVKQLQLTRIEE